MSRILSSSSPMLSVHSAASRHFLRGGSFMPFNIACQNRAWETEFSPHMKWKVSSISDCYRQNPSWTVANSWPIFIKGRLLWAAREVTSCWVAHWCIILTLHHSLMHLGSPLPSQTSSGLEAMFLAQEQEGAHWFQQPLHTQPQSSPKDWGNPPEQGELQARKEGRKHWKWSHHPFRQHKKHRIRW